MWLEVKALLTVMAMVFIAIPLAFMLYINILFAFLLFVAIGLFVFGDIIIGWQITKNDLKPQMDTTPPGKETMGLITLTNRFRIINTTKGPEGKREFRFNKENASVINKGDCQLRLLNGNSMFLAHESHDENINLAEAKYAENLEKEFKTTDLKIIHAKLKEKVEDG